MNEFMRIGDICDILNGYAFKSSKYVADGIRVIRITNVQKGFVEDTNPQYYPVSEQREIEKYMLCEGDYVSYYTVDWAGIMNEFRNVVGNNANYIPRVNAGLNLKRVNVFTFEVAYDLRFIELEKMKKLTLQKSIQDIYQNAIVAGWDLFVQKVAYTV